MYTTVLSNLVPYKESGLMCKRFEPSLFHGTTVGHKKHDTTNHKQQR